MPPSTYHSIYNKEYMTLCSFHVRPFATNLTIFMILIELVFLFPAEEYMANTSATFDVYNISTNIILAVTEVFVIYADKAVKPWAYLPFLFVITMFILMYSLGVATLIAQGENNSAGVDVKNIPITAIFASIFILISIYHFSLVYRARKYMIEEVLSGNTRKVAEERPESVETRNSITTFP